MKELCEGKESCQITPSKILAQHSKCQKVGWLVENILGFVVTKCYSVDKLISKYESFAKYLSCGCQIVTTWKVPNIKFVLLANISYRATDRPRDKVTY